MSSRKYATHFRLELKPSRRLGILLAGLHAIALLLILILDIHFFISGLMLLLIIISYVYYAGRYVLLRQNNAVILLRGEGVDWQLLNVAGEMQNVRLKDKFLSPFLVILYFIDQKGCRHTVPLFFDMLPPSLWRKIRVELRFSL